MKESLRKHNLLISFITIDSEDFQYNASKKRFEGENIGGVSENSENVEIF